MIVLIPVTFSNMKLLKTYNTTYYFNVLFHSDILLQIFFIFAYYYFGIKHPDVFCTLTDKLQLFEKFLPALSNQWLKNICLHLACRDFSIV